MIFLGSMMRCNTFSIETLQQRKDRAGQEGLSKGHNPGATRLPNPNIILSEVAYLVWTLQCERAIQERERTEKEVASENDYSNTRRQNRGDYGCRVTCLAWG
jgi:hypothetical protein